MGFIFWDADESHNKYVLVRFHLWFSGASVSHCWGGAPLHVLSWVHEKWDKISYHPRVYGSYKSVILRYLLLRSRVSALIWLVSHFRSRYWSDRHVSTRVDMGYLLVPLLRQKYWLCLWQVRVPLGLISHDRHRFQWSSRYLILTSWFQYQ